MGEASRIDPAIALDAVDEFLENVKSDRDIAVRARPARTDGERLAFRSADSSKAWGVELLSDGYTFVDSVINPDATLIAEPTELLAALLRRRPLVDCNVVITGDRSLVDHWLSETAFL
jgi:hypothetical protein